MWPEAALLMLRSTPNQLDCIGGDPLLQHPSCQCKHSCDVMIGLTCSWAWSRRTSCSSSPPKGAEESRARHSLCSSLYSFLHFSLHPFLSASFHWWPTCQQLLLWQAVHALHETERYGGFWKASLAVHWARYQRGPIAERWQRLRDVSLEMRDQDILRCASLRSVGSFWNSLRRVPYIRPLMSQWPR